jgi:hypothetical protein
MIKNIAMMISCLSLISCSPYQKFFRYDYNLKEAERIRKVVITPIEMIRARPRGTDYAMMKNIEHIIKNYMERNGYVVVSNKILEENWKNEVKNMDGFFDPATGKIDASKISGCLIKTIAKTKETEEFDGVVFIPLIERPAKLMGDRVYWDGCARKLLNDNGDVITEVTWRGEMKALSLQIQVFDNNHHLVFQSVGGIEFPYELKEEYSSKEFAWKKKMQFKEDEIFEGIAIAFHPLIQYDKYPEKPVYYE